MFEQMVVSRKVPKTGRRWSVALAITLQVAIVAVLLVIPLLFTEALPKTMLGTFLTAPPPPAPPPPPAAVAKVQPQRPKLAEVVKTNSFVAPTVIPKRVDTSAQPAPPQVAAANPGNGVPGGIGDAIGGIGNVPPPPPPKTAPQRIHVGGNVEAAKLVRKVTPRYPTIAQSAHIQGTVVLRAIIARDGSVQRLQYVSGPALLMASAMQAVREWKYQPTELNGQPVEVDTTIQVVYNLG